MNRFLSIDRIPRSAGLEGADVFDYFVEQPDAGGLGGPGDVRSNVTILRLQKRMIRRRRLDGEHVQTGAGNAAGVQSFGQACSSINGPRLVLIKKAVGFIEANRRASTRCRV